MIPQKITTQQQEPPAHLVLHLKAPLSAGSKTSATLECGRKSDCF